MDLALNQFLGLASQRPGGKAFGQLMRRERQCSGARYYYPFHTHVSRNLNAPVDCGSECQIPDQMNPRTATLTNSVWRSVTDNLFQSHIAQLWKLTSGRPKDPKMYTLPAARASTEDTLPLQVELDLAKCFAFISASGVGSEYVSAAAVKIPINAEDGLVLNIACNREVRPIVKEKLDEVVRHMRNVAAEGQYKLEQADQLLKKITQCSLEINGKDRVLETILELNRTRIKTRLQSRKRSRHFVLEGLQGILQHVRLQAQTDQLKMLATRLHSLCQSMHLYHRLSKQSQDIGNIKNLVVACYDFCSATNGESIKSMLICAGVDVDGTTRKPAYSTYWKNCSILSYCRDACCHCLETSISTFMPQHEHSIHTSLRPSSVQDCIKYGWRQSAVSCTR
jgi:hypothetical protein